MQYNIAMFNILNSHQYGNILEDLLKFRYKSFIIEEKYTVPTYYDSLEFDQYDNPYTQYIAILKAKNQIIACSRINRTDINYMAKECWHQYIPNNLLPSNANFYEWTRHATCSTLNTIERAKVTRITIVATYFALLKMNATGACFVTNSSLLNSVKNIGINVVNSTKINLPNFPNQNFSHIEVCHENKKNIIEKLFNSTGYNISNF